MYDIADLYKFETVVPIAFGVAARLQKTGGDARSAEGLVRRGCRDVFREQRFLGKIIPGIEDVLAAGGLPVPQPEGVVGPAFPDAPPTGDPGHRS